jgi:hypothetical protein
MEMMFSYLLSLHFIRWVCYILRTCVPHMHDEMEKGRSTKVRNYIPDDLALCIVSKLPLKSLKRFGCVRKSWSLLFDNDHFMNMFRNNFISYHHSYYDDTSLMLSTLTDFYSLSGDNFENIVKLRARLFEIFSHKNLFFC